jgi:hypothetical protein
VVAWQPLYIISLIIKSPLLIKKKKEKKKGQENQGNRLGCGETQDPSFLKTKKATKSKN